MANELPITANERPKKVQPTGAEIPRGLTFSELPAGKRRYQARWREPDGARKSVTFATEKQRTDFATAWIKKREQFGKSEPIVLPKEAVRWKLFAEMTGDADPIEVAKFWLEHRKVLGGEMKLREAVEKYLAIRQQRNLSTAADRHVNLHLNRFLTHFSAKRLCEVKADDVREWLAGLKNPDSGAPMEPWTVRDHLKSIKAFFCQAVVEQWIATNPIAVISPPKIEPEDVTVLPVESLIKLFTVNRDALCVGRLALEAFGGLRFSSVARLSREELLEAERGIIMPGHKHKSGRRHYVDGYPDNLWAWIKHAHQACWDINPRQYLELKSKAFRDAGVTNPGNVLRHSFCSYHVALHKDAARTAVLLTHRSPTMLYQHYKGRASEADAKRYFAIMP